VEGLAVITFGLGVFADPPRSTAEATQHQRRMLTALVELLDRLLEHRSRPEVVPDVAHEVAQVVEGSTESNRITELPAQRDLLVTHLDSQVGRPVTPSRLA